MAGGGALLRPIAAWRKNVVFDKMRAPGLNGWWWPGNPGEKYENTRHNVGFLTVDELAERARVPVQKLKHRALTNTLEVGASRCCS